jgi:hypothetical protein
MCEFLEENGYPFGEWEISEDESWPNWYGVITLQITVPQPVELFNLDEAGSVYGETYPSDSN